MKNKTDNVEIDNSKNSNSAWPQYGKNQQCVVGLVKICETGAF